MENKSYSEKLKDPRWQRKRLEVLQRDDFTCQYCKETEYTLHVHHMKYGKEPWDIDSKYLITLCESCHEMETDHRKEAEQMLLESLRLNHFNFSRVQWLSTIFGSCITPDWSKNEINLTHLNTIICKTEEWASGAIISNKEVNEAFFLSMQNSKDEPNLW